MKEKSSSKAPEFAPAEEKFEYRYDNYKESWVELIESSDLPSQAKDNYKKVL